MASLPSQRRPTLRSGTPLRLLGVASLLVLGLPSATLAQDAPPPSMPLLDATSDAATERSEPAEPEEELPNGDTPLGISSGIQLLPLPETEEAQPVATISSVRLLEELRSDQRIRRQYTRVTSRDTSIRRRQRTHEIQDRVRQDLEVELRFGTARHDPARIQVRVLSASQTSAGKHGPLNLAIPEQGLMLHCWQVDFDSLCRDVGTQNEVEWPQWAPLDFSPWTTSASINVGTRWRRIVPDADRAGWTDGHNKQTRASFEVMRSDSESSEASTLVEGVLETEAELMVFSEARRFPATGRLEFEFDNEAKLIDRFLINWKGELNFEGISGGEPYTWARSTQVRLIITSSIER